MRLVSAPRGVYLTIDFWRVMKGQAGTSFSLCSFGYVWGLLRVIPRNRYSGFRESVGDDGPLKGPLSHPVMAPSEAEMLVFRNIHYQGGSRLQSAKVSQLRMRGAPRLSRT